MNTTDPIADMLTRIRNANTSKHTEVDIPASNMKKAIAQILVDEGYIKPIFLRSFLETVQYMIEIIMSKTAVCLINKQNSDIVGSVCL